MVKTTLRDEGAEGENSARAGCRLHICRHRLVKQTPSHTLSHFPSNHKSVKTDVAINSVNAPRSTVGPVLRYFPGPRCTACT